jgi:DNA-directed RNA polymerase subunit L
MEFKIEHQGHTLGCLIRKFLDEECAEDYGTCTVIHPKDDFLFVAAPTPGHVRRAILEAKEEIKRLQTTLVVKKKRGRPSKHS